MIAHVWFIVVAFAGHPGDNLQLGRFPSRAACLASAPDRVAAFQTIGDHGRYLCMYHDEPDAALDREPAGRF